MNIVRVIRKSLEITLDYRALWVFGIILALTAPGGGGGNGSSGGGGGSSQLGPEMAGAWNPTALFDLGTLETALLIAAVVLSVILAVLFVIGRVVAETAVIRMTDRYETTGEKVTVGQGFRIGWSRAAFRIFLMDLLLGLGAVLVIMLILAVAFAPLLLTQTGSDVLGVLGGIGTAVLMGLAILLVILLVVTLIVAQQFFHRAAALENLGVFASIERGWAVLRANLGDTALLALLLFALGLALTLAIIPLVLFLAMGGAALGGIPGLLAGGLSSLFLEGEASLVVGIAVGLPLFLLALILPLLFISGLVKVFTANAWTLAYREMVARAAAR